MNIRKMVLEDIPEVLVADEKSFTKPWNEGMFTDEIKKEYADYYVAEADGEIIGYGGIWSIYETAELMRIAVIPEFRGRGIAKEIMEAMTECAKDRGCERMMLEVRKSNVSAQELYKKFGFCEISIRKGYYDGEDAVIMEATFKG